MKHLYPVIILALLAAYCATSHGQDSILFKTGKRMNCAVQGYTNGAFEVRLENGETKQAPAANISSISFGEESTTAPASATPVPEDVPVEEVAPAPRKIAETPEEIEAEMRAPKLNEDVKLTVKSYDNKVSLEHWESLKIRKKGMKAVAVNVQVENHTAKAIGVHGGSFTIKDQDNNVFEASSFWTGTRKTNIGFVEVPPGDKIATWIGFEVSPGIVMEESSIRYDKQPDGRTLECMYSDWFPVGK